MKRRIFAGLQILLRRNGFQWRKIACFLAASYILLVFLSLFLVIGIIFEEVRTVTRFLAAAVLLTRAFALPEESLSLL